MRIWPVLSSGLLVLALGACGSATAQPPAAQQQPTVTTNDDAFVGTTPNSSDPSPTDLSDPYTSDYSEPDPPDYSDSYSPDYSDSYTYGSPGSGDLDCVDVGHEVSIGGNDPNGLDADGDGIGCEGWGSAASDYSEPSDYDYPDPSDYDYPDPSDYEYPDPYDYQDPFEYYP